MTDDWRLVSTEIKYARKKHKCRWCGCDIHPQMENECVSCWSIRMRVTAHPDIAERILADLRNGSPAKSCG